MTGTHPAAPAKPRRRVSPRMVIAAVLVVLVAIFIAQNHETVQVHLFTVTVTSPTWLLLLIMALIGLVVGLLLGRRR